MNDKTISTQEKTVIALSFDGINAPVVTAKGSGATGEHIVQLAQEHGVPLHEDSSLAEALSHIPLGVEIPTEVYAVVAEVLAYIYFLDEQQSGPLDTEEIR